MRMIEVSDGVYEGLAQIAADGVRVETYRMGLARERSAPSESLDPRFTPKRIADLERISEAMDETGGSLSPEESWAGFEKLKRIR